MAGGSNYLIAIAFTPPIHQGALWTALQCTVDCTRVLYSALGNTLYTALYFNVQNITLQLHCTALPQMLASIGEWSMS